MVVCQWLSNNHWCTGVAYVEGRDEADRGTSNQPLTQVVPVITSYCWRMSSFLVWRKLFDWRSSEWPRCKHVPFGHMYYKYCYHIISCPNVGEKSRTSSWCLLENENVKIYLLNIKLVDLYPSKMEQGMLLLRCLRLRFVYLLFFLLLMNNMLNVFLFFLKNLD